MKKIKINREKPISVKWKIFGGLVFFIIIVIMVLWLFQVFFLERFYMYIKSNAVKDAANKINEILNDEDIESSITTIAKENDFCVAVYENTTSEIGDLQSSFTSSKGDVRCRIQEIKKNTNIIVELQEQVKETGGIASKMVEEKDNQPFDDAFLGNPFSQNITMKKPLEMQRKSFHNMTYISVVQGEKDTLKTVIIDAQLTPVNATIETIQTQFIIIAFILIFVAIGLAFYLSRKIAIPIIQMNESAKVLAKGTYDVEFQGKGYLEVQELSDTLNYAAKELSKVDNLRKELIANMSHDLRTPLTMISGYGEVMRDIPGENTPENVQIIIDETTRLTTLVNDMLDLSKLQAGVMELQISKFNITQEIKEIILRYDKLLTQHDIDIQFVYDQEVIAEGDRVKLGQVIYNLINNAINYCGDDQKVIVKQIILEGQVRFEFIDHGEGIEEEQLPYIWERYYKVDKTHVRSKVGTGLGLSIVKTILELHHASYGVRSKYKKGTIFWFQLPYEK